MSTVIESERKRLQSLKEKRQTFKAKKQIINIALKNVDTTKSNRIIFDDDFDEQQNWKSKGKKKRDLFDDDDGNGNDNEDSLWDENNFSMKKSIHVTLGNDKRFTLDDRFIDDKKVNKTIIRNTDECDLQKEKEKQLDILESVLGTPLTMRREKKKTEAKDGLMIRYDPTENRHSEYEINLAKLKESAEAKQLQDKEKSIKRKHEKHISETENPASIEVSKDIYFTVSDTLTESLKQKEGFSLLKACGREKDDKSIENCDATENDKDKKFKFNFNTKNIPKYNFSDEADANKDADEAPYVDKEIVDETKKDNYANKLFGACYKDTLFLDNDDVRFNEAVRFFDTEAISNNKFKNLRRELKMIVRTKIRKNEKRYQPYGKKRKIKRS